MPSVTAVARGPQHGAGASKASRLLCVLLALSMTHCAAHQAAIAKPPASADRSQWAAYYEAQLGTYGDGVEAPAEDAPLAQHAGYDDALERRHEGKQNREMLLVGGGALGIGLAVAAAAALVAGTIIFTVVVFDAFD